MKLVTREIATHEAGVNLALVVITALALQNLILVLALIRVAAPNLVVVLRALLRVAAHLTGVLS